MSFLTRKTLTIFVFTLALTLTYPPKTTYAQTTTCTAPFYSVTPALTDLGPNLYQRLTAINPLTYVPTAYTGGLYPNSSNVRPPEHEAAGLAIANTIQPLDANGNPDPNGKIGMGSIGMSNTNSEFEGFMGTYVNQTTQTEANDKLKVVNTAAPGAVAEFWVNPALAPYNNIWNYWVAQRISQGQLTNAQMQVFWVKLTEPALNGEPFPTGAQTLTGYYVQLMHELKARFPNVKMVYISSRTRSYGYFDALSPEPVAFENGLSVKWLIERQLNGDPELNYDPANGPVTSPYISWGPYLWIDGTNPRSDGMTWLNSDLAEDCVHPSASGNAKVASMLWNFFRNDSTTQAWFVDPGVTPPVNTAPTVNAGNDRTVYLSDSLDMHATVTDDGLPTSVQVTANWNVISGPGYVEMTNWNSKDTVITFDTLGTYELSITVSDTEFTDEDTVVVNVVPDLPNQPPVAQDSSHGTYTNEAITFDLPYTDPDINDTHTFTIETQPATGTLTESNGSVTYTPDGTTVGNVTFTWSTFDGEDMSNIATATIALSEPPEIHPDVISLFNFEASGNLVDLLNSCTGCAINGATWTNNGETNGAYVFDGINDYLNLGTYPYLNNKSAFTFSVWVKPNFTPTYTGSAMVFNTPGQLSVQYLGPINDWRATVRINGVNKTVDTVGTSWSTNTWHLLTVTYDGATVRAYFDGTPHGTRAATGNVNAASAAYVGGIVGPSAWFNGSIDEVKTYSRALNAQEVLEEAGL